MALVAAEHRSEQRPVSYYEQHLQLRDNRTEQTSDANWSEALMPGAPLERDALATEKPSPLKASAAVESETTAREFVPEDLGYSAEEQTGFHAAADRPPIDGSTDASATPTFEAISTRHLAATGAALDQLISQLRTTGANIGSLVASATGNALPPDVVQSLNETLSQVQLAQGATDAEGMNAALASQLETVREGLAKAQHELPAMQEAARELPPALQALGTGSPADLPGVVSLLADPGALLQTMIEEAGSSATPTAAQGWSSMRAAASSAAEARQGDVDALVRGTDPTSLLQAFTGDTRSAAAAPAGSAAGEAYKLSALARTQMPAWAAEQLASANADGIPSALENMESALSMRDASQEAGVSPQELLKQAQGAFEAMAAERESAPDEPGVPAGEDAALSGGDRPVVADPSMAVPPLVGDLAYARRHAVDRALAGHDVTDAEATELGQQLLAALRQGESLEGRDFAGADLRGANLRGAVLSGVYLECARLQGACLVGARAENAVFVGACLDNADCSGGQFIGANLNAVQARDSAWTGADMSEGTMVGSRFERARATGAVMVGCVATRSEWLGANLDASRMEGALFDSADFRHASWRNAQWSRVDAQSCQLDEVDATGAQLSSCRFVDAQGAAWCLEDACIEGSAFLDARLPQLKGARLAAKDTTWHASTLTGADFEQADLENAYLAEAHLADASLVRADLRNAMFNGAVLRGSSFAQAQLLGAHLRCVDASRGDFRQAQLRKSDFTGARLDCADMTGADLPAGPLTLPNHV